MEQVRAHLRNLLGKAGHFTEARFHSRRTRVIAVRKGEVHELSSKHYAGIGIRVLVGGSWGFASTSDTSETGLAQAIKTAEQMAKELQSRKGQKVTLAKPGALAVGEFFVPGYDELDAMSLEEKFERVRSSEEVMRSNSKMIESAVCSYSEAFEDKYILTTDGADAHIRLARPELRFVAFGADGSKHTEGRQSVGGTGSWSCLFHNRSLEQMVDDASSNAVELLSADEADGGKKKVILSPAMVGLLSHEAIGHTVEADFVESGSVAAGKLGQTVASELVTLADSGNSELHEGAGGIIPVDDEGVIAGRTEVIKDGKLVSYLHNRESAQRFGVEPTGNARAWEFSDEPLIRMTNTYIQPGQDDLDQMISEIDDGYFVDGPEGGQADATAEFMFGANRVRRIQNGKLGDYVQKVSLSGNAFEVLQSVDAVSRDFQWDLGAGYCGKGQPAKVDAGGPYLRCELIVGGK